MAKHMGGFFMELCKNKIDVHIHTMDIEPEFKHLAEAPSAIDIIEKYKINGIEKGILQTLVSPESRRFLITTENAMEVSKKYNEKFHFAMGLDPRMFKNTENADFTPLLKYYKSKGAVSVGEMTANLYFDDPLYDNLLSQCADFDLPVTIHISPKVGLAYGIVDEAGLYRLEKMLKKYPKLKIIGHSWDFWNYLYKDTEVKKSEEGRLFELFGKYDNFYADFSAGSGFTAIRKDEINGLKFINTFKDRVMFGTDCLFDNEGFNPLALWLDENYLNGNLSKELYFNFCRENAVKIFKL